ncbi:hypothetical protein [Streptomyces sp. NPDC058382]
MFQEATTADALQMREWLERGQLLVGPARVLRCRLEGRRPGRFTV